MTIDLDVLEGLAQAATPGPWGVEDPMDHCLTVVANPSDPVYDWKWIATCDWPDEDDHLVTSSEVKTNAALIVAAVNALPDLIAAARERDRLRGRLAILEEERKREGVNLAHLKRAIAVQYAQALQAGEKG